LVFTCLQPPYPNISIGVEAKVIAAFMSLVLRLNEVLFKPLFLKVLDWAIGSGVSWFLLHLLVFSIINCSQVKKNKSDNEHAGATNGVHIESGPRSPAKVAFFYRLVDSLTEHLKVRSLRFQFSVLTFS
jgi:hypothetical protein